ncbi:MAG TPA: murein biosynthesis integral membrane protein MurJ [Bryobacteraceae bacterium]|nr:murein biosynthesis integral membrane protein MurJ [Bryobacteraceae bacterium]
MRPIGQITSTKGRGSLLVAAGILLSRIAGLIRLRVFSHYFGLASDAADAFYAAFRIPNFLQNLFGEGVLSASFIPVYAGLLAKKDNESANRVAGAVFAILALLTSVLALAGALAAPWLIVAIAPGFTGPKRDLTIQLVRILFPGAAILVLSAWCLGILNSHRRFLLSYAAPVMWNAVMIAVLLAFGRQSTLDQLAILLAWGSVLGGVLQFAIQLRPVLQLTRALRLRFSRSDESVNTVVRNFIPVFISRGVVQISAYIDTILASPLPTGAVVALFNAQVLYTLPVSLFGMAVSAAELPAMSGIVAEGTDVANYLRERLQKALQDIAFWIVPSATAFLALGDIVAGTLLQTGRFTSADADYIWGILAGSAIGLLASTMGRLYSSTFYALKDARTPLRFAIARVSVATGLGAAAALYVPQALGIPARWGAAGITAASAIAAWIEYLLLRRALEHRIGPSRLPLTAFFRLWSCALPAALAALAAKRYLSAPWHPTVIGAIILGTFGIVYFGLALVLRVPQTAAVLRRLRR